MRILVTGNEGFIGKNVASYLQQQGHEVEGWEWQPGVLPSTEDYDWCIHLGAISSTTYTDVNQGGDYTVEQVVGHDLADVHLVPTVEGYSTTQIIEASK